MPFSAVMCCSLAVAFPLWYTYSHQVHGTRVEGGSGGMSNSAAAEVFWTIFSNTGSVIAYLLYKRFTVQ